MEMIKAPQSFEGSPRPWVYLAGGTEMNEAVDWRLVVTQLLRESNWSGTILKPRPEAWDLSQGNTIDNPQFREYVEWELRAQEEADWILAYLTIGPVGTGTPMAMFELGLFGRGPKVVICWANDFWWKSRLDIVCQRYAIKQVVGLHALAAEVHKSFQVATDEFYERALRPARDFIPYGENRCKLGTWKTPSSLQTARQTAGAGTQVRSRLPTSSWWPRSNGCESCWRLQSRSRW